jgi:hypothetical protein
MLAQTPPYGHSADTITGKFSVNISRLDLGSLWCVNALHPDVCWNSGLHWFA